MTVKPKALIVGGSGFIGSQLGQDLCRSGFDINVLARRPDELKGRLSYPATLYGWQSKDLPREALEGVSVIINLAGEGIAEQPWTKEQKDLIVSSRVETTVQLVKAIRELKTRPECFIQASAIGFYGDRGESELDEESSLGKGFLAETCQAVEREAFEVKALGVRHVIFRIGIVLGHGGGALAKLLELAARGLLAPLGDGRQWQSWIHIGDLTRMITQAVIDKSWRGVINATAPEPCRQGELTEAIAEHGAFRIAPKVPKALVKGVMPGRAQLLLDSARVRPMSALALDFEFLFPTISKALAKLLGDSVAPGLNRLYRQQWFKDPPAALWPFFSEAANLERITPPWLNFKIDSMSQSEPCEGLDIQYSLSLHGVGIKWRSRIVHWQPPYSFVDNQESGPYKLWYHLHSFAPLGGGTVATDMVQYALPLGKFGELGAGWYVAKELKRIFDFRSSAMAALLHNQSM